MNMKKVFISFMAVLLSLVTVFPTASVIASNENYVIVTSELHFDTEEEALEAINAIIESEYQIQALPAVAVFVAGILAGFIVDGVILSVTDFSAAQWVAIGIAYASCDKTFFLDPDTGATACKNSRGGGTTW